jgi:hypothetical protein
MPEISRHQIPEAFTGAAIGSDENAVLLLLADGSLARFDIDSGELDTLAHAKLLPLAPDPDSDGSAWTPSFSLRTSPSGRYASVAVDHTRKGALVLDLTTGLTALTLSEPEPDNPETVPFSICFISHDGRELVVHRTEWNRLDISDPGTGELLPARESPRHDDPSPDSHYLEFYHGRLTPNSRGNLILDDGWVWHPFGWVYTIDAERWLGVNIWESEDVVRTSGLIDREDWNLGDCWIDDRRVAIRAVGENSDDPATKAFDGARIFDVDKPDNPPQLIAGARGRFLSDGSHLFAVHDGATDIWSIDDAPEIQGTIETFEPTFVIPSRPALVQVNGTELVVWKP